MDECSDAASTEALRLERRASPTVVEIE